MSNKKRERFPVEKYFNGQEIAVADAIYYGDKKQLEKLINQGIPINHVGKEGFTYLMYAVMIENYEVTEFLLKNGADPNQLSPFIKYKNPIEMEDGKIWPLNMLPLATCCGDSYSIKWLKLLVKYKADLNDNRAKTPMYTAIISSDMEKVKYLLDCGAEVNQIYQSNTPIMTAAIVMNWDVTEYLLNCGADVFHVNEDGYSLGFYLQKYLNRDIWTTEERKRIEGLILRLKEKGVQFPVMKQKPTPADPVSKANTQPVSTDQVDKRQVKTPPTKPPHSWILDDDDNWIIS